MLPPPCHPAWPPPAWLPPPPMGSRFYDLCGSPHRALRRPAPPLARHPSPPLR
eukprot:gene12652-15929_t